ncbi:hypothetical protein F5883DRAFT_559794 [Diaporthe sp. PMI_573]|nr:hypothetical protein F5883DRAFT_559794 [Diaporthaceae sp. PMI_573]
MESGNRKDYTITFNWATVLMQTVEFTNGGGQVLIVTTASDNARVPSYIRTQMDWTLHQLPVQRAASGPIFSMVPILMSLGKEVATHWQALLCQTRGYEAPDTCRHCEERRGVFNKCVLLQNEFKNRCANCIFDERWDCELATIYNTEPDYDCVPPQQQLAQGGEDQTRASLTLLRGSRQRGQMEQGQQKGQMEQGQQKGQIGERQQRGQIEQGQQRGQMREGQQRGQMGQGQQRGLRGQGQQRRQRRQRLRGSEHRSSRPGPRRPGRSEQRPAPRPRTSRERREILASRGTAERPIDLDLL